MLQQLILNTKLQLQSKPNIPAVGLSSCEHSVTSLLSASVFISDDGNSMELTSHVQHDNIFPYVNAIQTVSDLNDQKQTQKIQIPAMNENILA